MTSCLFVMELSNSRGPDPSWARDPFLLLSAFFCLSLSLHLWRIRSTMLKLVQMSNTYVSMSPPNLTWDIHMPGNYVSLLWNSYLLGILNVCLDLGAIQSPPSENSLFPLSFTLTPSLFPWSRDWLWCLAWSMIQCCLLSTVAGEMRGDRLTTLSRTSKQKEHPRGQCWAGQRNCQNKSALFQWLLLNRAPGEVRCPFTEYVGHWGTGILHFMTFSQKNLVTWPHLWIQCNHDHQT